MPVDISIRRILVTTELTSIESAKSRENKSAHELEYL